MFEILNQHHYPYTNTLYEEHQIKQTRLNEILYHHVYLIQTRTIPVNTISEEHLKKISLHLAQICTWTQG